MEKYQEIDNSEIFLFRVQNETQVINSSINEFIAYLKFKKVPGPYKFSFVGSSGNLINDLTLKQNLLLDYTSASMSEEKEVHFKNFLKNRPNLKLEALYSLINNINDLPSNSTAEEIKLISLIKALISGANFLFFEKPEDDLSESTFRLFQEALQVQIEANDQNIFVLTDKESNWLHYSSKIVTRNKDFSFKTTSVEKMPSFSEEKAKFYKSEEKEVANQSHLVFKIPKKKKSAA